MCKRVLSAVCFLLFTLVLGSGEAAAEKWITEAQMKQLSAKARNYQLMLTQLSCRFQADVDTPGREHVLFKPVFEQVAEVTPWGWTFDANQALPGPEKQARDAGFEIASEDYYEITGVTWVRCRVWHRP